MKGHAEHAGAGRHGEVTKLTLEVEPDALQRHILTLVDIDGFDQAVRVYGLKRVQNALWMYGTNDPYTNEIRGWMFYEDRMLEAKASFDEHGVPAGHEEAWAREWAEYTWRKMQRNARHRDE